jgi:hypothetical protein
MENLVETLARELERPRDVTAQVVRHLGGNKGIKDDEIGAVLADTLPTLEDDEVDLILSPMFTPKLDDQAVVAARLGAESIPADEQNRLIAEIVSRPTDAAFVTSDGETHAHRLGAVTVERYVLRLRLEGTIPASTFDLIQQFGESERGLLQAIARRAIWENGRANILEGYLSATLGPDDDIANDTRELLDIVERYKPADIGDLVSKIPRWREDLRGDLGIASGGRPFFSERIAQSHGGANDHRAAEAGMIEGKKKDLAFLERLERVLLG